MRSAEIIVIDDASTDDGLARVRDYSEVRIITRAEPGPGGYAARNAGVAAAMGNWIAFLDADDAWEPEHLAECTNLIRCAERDPVIAASGYRVCRADGRVGLDVYARHRPAAGPATFDFESFVALWLEIGECPVWTSALVAKRSALLHVGGFPAERCRRGGDKDAWLRLAYQGGVVVGTRATATYFKDSINMVTAKRHANLRPCLVATLEHWISQTSPERRRLLRRLRNHETFGYALRTVKTERLRFAAWRGFSARENPLHFAVLVLLTSPLGHMIGRLMSRLKSKAIVGRLKSWLLAAR